MKKFLCVLLFVAFALLMPIRAYAEEGEDVVGDIPVSESTDVTEDTIKECPEYSEDDIWEIASVVYSEANNQTEKGKRLVIDVILNRVEHKKFPDTLTGVLTQKKQFTKLRVEPTDELLNLVHEELIARTNNDVLFFKTKNYHSFAVPIIKEDDHYFSGLED